MPEHSRHNDGNIDQSEQAKTAQLAIDAKNLIKIAENQSAKLDKTVNPIDLARRKEDDIDALQAAIDKEQGAVKPAVYAVMEEVELSPEQIWLNNFKTRFNDPKLSKLHEGIGWEDVERSLMADPESMRKLQAFDEKGHAMNVFGEDGDEFIFASAWSNYKEVSKDHRNITYDLEGQQLAERDGDTPTGNAVSIIAKIMGVKEDEAERYLADPALHEKLEVIGINGWACLKTDSANREYGIAFFGSASGIYHGLARSHGTGGSFRATRRVKKVLA